MKNLLELWSCRILVGALILCMCCGDVLCRKRVRPHRLTPTTKPRASNNTNNSSNSGENDAENGFALQQPEQQTGILNLGCFGIKIRRYVSNGFCTSKRPIRDMICEGQCLPMDELMWSRNVYKVLSRRKREWRCVPDRTRRRNVKVLCANGKEEKHRIKITRSCKCKRYTREQNMTKLSKVPKKKLQKR